MAEDTVLGLKMPQALEDARLPERLRQALKEWWEWYDPRYGMPVEVDIKPGVVRVIISYNIEPELRECENMCVQKYGEEVRRELEAEGIKGEEVEEDIWRGCHEACIEDIVRDVYVSFGEVIRKLDEVLKKYGIKAESEGGWEGYTRWIRYDIRL